MAFILYVFPPSPRAFKVLAVANYLCLEYEARLVHLFRGDQNAPEFAAMNPNRRMPVLWDDGYALWESNAILQYLAARRPEFALGPRGIREQAEVNRWQFWEVAHWEPALGTLIFEHLKKPALTGEKPDTAAIQRGEEAFHLVANTLNRHLLERSFIACGRLTIADFSLSSFLNAAGAAKYPMARYPEIRRWYESLTMLPVWTQTLQQTQNIMHCAGYGDPAGSSRAPSADRPT
jgi:glutathione S-transferase